MDGWDNRTYRLGADMSVRRPTAASYAPAVAKESVWLPRLAPKLPVAIPTVLAVGTPGCGYAFSWSVRDWLPADTAGRAAITDMTQFAADVAEFGADRVLLAAQAADEEVQCGLVIGGDGG
ncbi:phosphotransferase [Nocardia abscessus]|uniref:phosphotransferase n=1 Tax=Nocardia abscessus TaxID=120957 RepID=UPI002458BF5A|nr:phosphotransferase [Nocardia abscessus]